MMDSSVVLLNEQISRRERPPLEQDPEKTVTFSSSNVTAKSLVKSSHIMKAITLNLSMGTTKSKSGRGRSKSVVRAQPQLVFEYGPTSYRGLLAHRKVKLIPFAGIHNVPNGDEKHFQREYPDIRVYYKPTTAYNTVCVQLKDSVVYRGLLSRVPYPKAGNLTSLQFYKAVNDAIQRMSKYPNLLTRPFRDPICLMTHNLDVDYDVPWYRTQFPGHVVVGHCQIEWDDESNYFWQTFRNKIENSPGYESLMNEIH